MSGYLLDTHLWIWFQQGNATKLSPAVVAEFEAWQRRRSLYVSAYSAWEIGLLVSKRQITLSTPVESWVAAGTTDGGLQLIDVSVRVLIESTRLPGDVHRDPADRMLLATVREHGMTLVTRDDRLVAYGAQGHARVMRR